MPQRSFFILIILILIAPPLSWAAIPPQAPVTYAPIIKKVAPAVVSISNLQNVNLPNLLFSNDPFFNFFFGGGAQNSTDLPQKPFSKSLGSGVIVDPTGIVVTCGHVIENAEKILVTLSDNREFEGTVIVRDKQNDLAAIQLKGIQPNILLPAVALEQNDVEVGDPILAIGNPFGVGQTVTSGIISAIARNVRGRMLIQTDASINPGNSGGALISMNGNLVGIPNAILSKTGLSHGIGFAIPEGLIRILLNSINNGGVIIRPWAGIAVQRLTNDMAKALGLPTPQGVLITSLHTSSPALAAGLKQGDVITTINGMNISNPEEFIYRIQTVSLGQVISLDIQRNGQPQQISFQPIEPPAIPAPDERLIPATSKMLKGLKVANLSPALISKYQLSVETPEKGVVITDVGNNIIALQFPLNQGDIIEAVNQHPIESVEDLFNTLATSPKEESIRIRHGNRQIEIKTNP